MVEGGWHSCSSSVQFSGVSSIPQFPFSTAPDFITIFTGANGVMVWDYFTDSSVHIGLCEAVTAFMGGTYVHVFHLSSSYL